MRPAITRRHRHHHHHHQRNLINVPSSQQQTPTVPHFYKYFTHTYTLPTTRHQKQPIFASTECGRANRQNSQF
ncbi:unnamed protein product [Rhodiola kirilowii]